MVVIPSVGRESVHKPERGRRQVERGSKPHSCNVPCSLFGLNVEFNNDMTTKTALTNKKTFHV